jgi:glycosyltransferase involved in cell wall biosynthesis
MKILFVHNKYKFRGGEDATLQMEVELLAGKGHEVNVLQFDNDDIDGLFSKIKTGLRALYNGRSAQLLEQRIKNFKPDVVHVHNLFFTASPSVLYKAKAMHVPVIMTIHNYRLICANALLLRDNHVCELCVNKTFPLDGIRYKCYRGSAAESALVTSITSIHKILSTWKNKIDQFIVVSNFMKEKLQHSSLQLPENKTVVLPNLSEDLAPGSGSRSDYFLFAGRLSYEKGIDILLESFANLPQIKLVIAGDGPLKEMVMQRIQNLPNITYAGLQTKEQVASLMKECKALVFPSRWYEGMPITIIESFATGTPIIAAQIGAMPEMIQDGYNGFLFEAGNSVALAHRIRQFESMNEQAEQLYKDARQTYIDRYHPDIHYNSLLTIYEKTIAGVSTNAR